MIARLRRKLTLLVIAVLLLVTAGIIFAISFSTFQTDICHTLRYRLCCFKLLMFHSNGDLSSSSITEDPLIQTY